MEYIETSIKGIRNEVGELQKRYNWEMLMSMENSKMMRQKLRKLIQKYNVGVVVSYGYLANMCVC